MDFETTGLDPYTDRIVGLSIADEAFPMGVYFNFMDAALDRPELMRRIGNRLKICHNTTFEMLMEYMYWERMGITIEPQYSHCTQGLLVQFEGDFAGGYTRGQSNKKLKVLQTELLGWDKRGDVELDNWLITNGYHDKKGNPLKGEMHRAPVSILGFYGALDSQATYALYKHIYRPVLNQYPELDLFHSRDYMNLLSLINEQRLGGMQIAKKDLIYYISVLEWMIDTLRYEFIHYSPATKYIIEFNEAAVAKVAGKEPSKVNKDGKTPNKNWAKWKVRYENAVKTNHFNTNSKPQMGWIFYDCLFKTRKYKATNWKKEEIWKLDIELENEVVTIECTKEGQRPVDLKILPRLGEAGELLYEYNKLTKELSYCVSLLDQIGDGDIYHPQLIASGAKTDRSAGTGGHNVQQQPKTYDYMKCYTHRPGHKLIQMDIDALEAVVLAEVSECRSYMKLYGPDAPKGNDVYLFVGSGMGSISDPIKEEGYDPHNPDPAIVKKCKKKFKWERDVFKKFHLSAQYGAGAFRIWNDLKLQKVYIPLDHVKIMREKYWELFKDVKTYEARLLDERTANGGFFVNGLGFPITIAEAFLKDTLNRAIQPAGHSILIRYLYHLNQIRKDTNLMFWPILCDFHDETIWECHEEAVPCVMEAFRMAWIETNKELGGIIPLSGEPETCTSWADFKVELPRGIL